MDTIQHIIWDTTLARIGDSEFADYLCHAYCHAGHCTFERHNSQFRMEAGDCLIVPRRGDLVRNLRESSDFQVDVIYVTQKFIELSTPQSRSTFGRFACEELRYARPSGSIRESHHAAEA